MKGHRPIDFVDLAAQRERLGAPLDDAIEGVLAHGRYIMGPEVGEFERALADYCGVVDAVACSSGTDALILALMAVGIGPGDAVFVPSFTFAATAEAVVLVGGTPVFVDVDPRSLTVSVESLERSIRSVPGLRCRAVVPVDLFGHPADYPGILEVADRYDLVVIADAAQSFGATLGEQRVGELAPLTTTSFFPAKPLGCYGDGGAVVFRDPAMGEVLRSLRAHGQGADKYDNVRIGLNGRLDTIQAAILLVKLTVFDEELRRRRAIAGRYSDGLRNHVSIPNVAAGVRPTWAQYTISVANRDQLAKRLRERGVPTAVYYRRPVHLQTAYDTYPIDPEGLATSENLADCVLSLPMHPYLDEPSQDRIISEIVESST